MTRGVDSPTEATVGDFPTVAPARRFEWERVVRRVNMHATTKYLALVLATYADQDGSRIRPGVERLGRVMCTSEKTVKRHLATLRSDGLIERVKQGNRWTHQADEYRLTLPFDLLERGLLDPDENESLGVTHDT